MPSDPKRPQTRQRDDAIAESPVESPEADAAEQRATLGDDNDDWLNNTTFSADDEVTEADAVEQSREVGNDEDDYR
ncbi:hypothetical protein HDA32_000854 [Spinactinospora alkalitolerans]|uniref:Uncharacterized protein n=1 Tax=Spinactinospora alkalitolerans TaxID=687207 RepID=A0A852TUD9_9ACTN|nr:hypothetical protein [Spinactinospora alkalitolerans]NYE45734.1 hypothetical protein [Spinactinospora alkalitolerans]